MMLDGPGVCVSVSRWAHDARSGREVDLPGTSASQAPRHWFGVHWSSGTCGRFPFTRARRAFSLCLGAGSCFVGKQYSHWSGFAAQCVAVIFGLTILLHSSQWSLGGTIAFVVAVGIWLRKHDREQAERRTADAKAKAKDEQAVRLIGAPVAELRSMFAMSDELIDRLLNDPNARAIAAAHFAAVKLPGNRQDEADGGRAPATVDFIERNPVPDSLMLGRLIQKPDRAG